MKKRFQRVISLLLCIALAVGLLPSVGLFASAADTVYTYSFIANDYASGLLSYNGLPRYTDYSSATYAADQRNWKYVGMSDATYEKWEASTGTNDGRSRAGFDTGGIRFTPVASSEWFAVSLRVPEPGIYKVSYMAPINITGLTTKGTVSIFPGGTTEAKIKGYSNTVFTSANLLEYKTVDFNSSEATSVEREVGTNVVAINGENGGEIVVAVGFSETKAARFRGFKLTKVSDELNVSAEELSLKVGGETATVTATLKTNTLQKCLSADYEIEDESIATVKNGAVTPVAAGWTILNIALGDLTKKILIGVADASGNVPGNKPSLEPVLSLPYEFIHVGDSVKIVNANSSYTYTSSDDSVATVAADGTITGVGMGSATITATKGEIVKTFELPVVGANLLIRNGYDHGKFENGIYFSDGSGTVDKTKTFWEASRKDTDYVFDFAMVSVNLPGRKDLSNAAKFTFDGNGTPGSNGRITMKVTAPASTPAKNSDRGMILAEDNKLYEFSGWVAAENTEVLGDFWHMLTYYDYKDGTATEIRGHSLKPWDGKSGNQPWQMLTLPAVMIDHSEYTEVWMRPYMQSISATKVGDILMTEYSVHEVIYDKLEISAEKTKIEASETLSLSAKHYSNTGNEIKQMISGKISNPNIPVTYESLDTEVVRVIDDKGTLLGVSDGTAKVKATATICGVTVSEEIEITVEGGERPIFIGELNLEIKGENIRPATYAVAVVTAKDENGDPLELDADDITYTSSNEAVATVATNGVIRAKTVGETDITASVTKAGTTKTATARLTVVDYPAASALPEIIAARLVADFVELGSEGTIVVTDMNGENLGGGITYTYAINDESIATLDGAVVTGKKIGKTYVTVTATLGDETRTARAPIAVVGSNLLIRYGVNHGELENGIYLTDKSADTPQYSSFWSAAHTEARGLYTYELLRGVFSDITGAPTNVVKFTMPDGLVADNLKLIRVQGVTGAFSSTNGRHTGFVVVDANKLYEYTGYMKTENAIELPENACGTLSYYNGNSSSATQLSNYKSAPWVGKTGDQDWTKFTINPLLINWPSVKTFTVRPGFEAQTADENPGYEWYVSHISFHEVVFDEVRFACAESFEGAATYDTFKTTATLHSNTGSQIGVGNTADPIPVTYASTNETVAKISEDGTITAISDGTCKVTATATILGITNTAEIEVTFSGLEVMFDRVDATCETELDVGETTTVATKAMNTDDSDYTGEIELYFESSDTSVATVTQEGFVTAKKSGEADIIVYGIVGDRRVKTVINVKVSDTTPLVSANIRGSSSIELGFSKQLTAEAVHESGSPAKMDECEVVFSLYDEESAEIVSVTEAGKVTALAEGTARVVVTVTEKYGTTMTSAPFEIMVTPKSPKSKIFDFAQYPTNTSALLQTIEKDDWEINKDLSSSAIISGVLGNLRYLPATMSSKVGGTGHTQNADTVIDLKIDYDGWYQIDFAGSQTTSGASLVYIYMDNAFLGEFTFYDPDGATTLPSTELNTMYLTAGVHQFTVRSMQAGDPAQASHTRGQTIKSISFTYLEDDLTINEPVFHIDRTSLAVGETSNVIVDASLSDGRLFSFGNVKGNKADAKSNLKVTSSDPETVEYKDGKLIAKKAGKVTLTAKTLIYGQESEDSVEITVTDEALSRIEAINPEGISLYVGETKDIELRAFVEGTDSDEREVAIEDITLSYVLDSEVATIADRKVTATTVGEALLTVTSTLDGVKTLTSYIPIKVLADGYASVELGAVSQVLKVSGETSQLFVKAYDNFGKEINADGAEISYTVSDSEIITVNESGRVIPGSSVGVAEVFATVTIDGITHKTNAVTISVRDGKVGSTYYTPERVAAARENIEKYDWAKSTAKTAVAKADKYLEHVETIYNIITNHTIPRTSYLGTDDDPNVGMCMYCGKTLTKKWIVNTLVRPWKIQCPDCSRMFPSNDFDKFYRLGLDEHGEFNRQLALEENGILCGRGERNEDGEYVVFEQYADNPYGYGDPNGNLYNKLYKELYTSNIDPFAKTQIGQGWGDFKVGGDSGIPSEGYFWGVDDSLGYDTGRVHPNGEKEIHRYVGLFNYFGIWYNHANKEQPVVFASLSAFRDAYLYTGEKKYARAGAIILDRVADLYPDFDYMLDCPKLVTSGKGNGKISGYIHENFVNRPFTTSYDAFFDIYDDPQVISFLSEYAKKWNLDNKKTDGELLRQNVENNILYETFNAVKKAQIKGNFGMQQDTLTKAAVILDRAPDTAEMIDFTMRAGESAGTYVTGGSLYSGIMNNLDRDGYGNEGSLSYNGIFSSSFTEVINTLSYYDKVKAKYDLINNPKVIASFTLGADTIIAGMQHANIGDASATFGGNRKYTSYKDQWLLGLQTTGDPLFAQLLYLTNGKSAKGLRYDIFTRNPESPEKLVEEIIEKYGEFDLSRSDMLTGYGFAALRGGVKYADVSSGTRENTMHDFWMYFGGGDVTTHKHREINNLGVSAFGLDITPDHGYGGSGGLASQGNNVEYWIEGTLSHNTVMVNDAQQSRYAFTFPLHFEDAGAVQIMDVDAPQAYEDITDTYRRTVVSIDIDDSIAYALDFFRIVGGDEHLYSFHSMSEESVVDGVTFVRQPQGSYAGVEYEVGDIYYSRTDGFNCLENVERAVYPDSREYSIDWKITDYRKTVSANRDLHLKLTQINDFDASEVVRADGLCIDDPSNPRNTDYLLVRRSGENLDTLFTSVIEPYEDESKIKSIENASVVRADGGEIRESDAVKAVRVELTTGRVDYVVYSARNDVEYRIDDLFDFCGFVGVYTVNAEDSSDVVRTYINDGTKLGDVVLESAALEGEVIDFTDALNYNDGKPILDNYLEVTANCDVAPESLIGKMIVIENDGVENGAYIIRSAEKSGNNYILGTGDVNFYRALADDNETHIWNIERGQSYRIPLSAYADASSEISVSGEYTTTVGGAITIPINVVSEREYTLSGTTLPRGMTLDAENGKLMWTPTASQIGDNHVAVTVDNGVLSNTLHFIVTVYGSTGGGAGGGGSSAQSKPTETPTIPATKPDDKDNAGNATDNVGDDVPQTPATTERFIDLGNHAWARDAINNLADAGIVKGTSENTFSPAANITRADFAILLVRAFELASENEENFADVQSSDYFAKELAIARNTGLVNGIGDNKFAPRNNITRQDMMVIVYRTLKSMDKLDVGDGVLDVPQASDFANVADYAKEAVSALVNAKLVNGKNGLIAPTDYTTRAEVAVLVERILDYVK